MLLRPRIVTILALMLPALLLAQGRGGGVPPVAAAPGTVNRSYVRENFTNFQYRTPMRDGVKLFTSVYVPT